MCSGCWTRYGSPTDLPENAREVADLIARLYRQPDGGVGGPLHVVLDDWNLEDEYLTPYAGRTWDLVTWQLAQRISSALRAMTLEQRAALLHRIHYGIVT